MIKVARSYINADSAKKLTSAGYAVKLSDRGYWTVSNVDETADEITDSLRENGWKDIDNNLVRGGHVEESIISEKLTHGTKVVVTQGKCKGQTGSIREIHTANGRVTKYDLDMTNKTDGNGNGQLVIDKDKVKGVKSMQKESINEAAIKIQFGFVRDKFDFMDSAEEFGVKVRPSADEKTAVLKGKQDDLDAFIEEYNLRKKVLLKKESILDRALNILID